MVDSHCDRIETRFGPDALSSIEESIAKLSDPERLAKLRHLLVDWECSDLREHRMMYSREIDGRANTTLRQLARDGRKALKKISQAPGHAVALAQNLDDFTKSALAYVIVTRNGDLLNREDYEDTIERLESGSASLSNVILDAAPDALGRATAGQPRNTASYLIMLDLEAIFRWLTGKTPARSVNRDTGLEEGDFFCFSHRVWRAVFGTAEGHQAATKNWAEAKCTRRSDTRPLKRRRFAAAAE